MPSKPLVAFIGPSGVGKTSFSRRLISEYHFAQADVANTRPARSDDGPHHHSVDDAIFDQLEREGKFLETDTFTTYRYGTFVDSVRRLSLDPEVVGVLLDLTPHGFKQASLVYPNLTAIVLVPDDVGWLKERLKIRNTQSLQDQERREAILVEYLDSVRGLGLATVVVGFEPSSWENTFKEILEIIRGAA